jgi:hypothetical protein
LDKRLLFLSIAFICHSNFSPFKRTGEVCFSYYTTLKLTDQVSASKDNKSQWLVIEEVLSWGQISGVGILNAILQDGLSLDS